MTYMSKKRWGMTLYANQGWLSVCITPSLSVDYTRKNRPVIKNKWRRLTITLHWLAWWASLEIMWG